MAGPEPDIETLEREHVEELARAHAALAEAQDRSYWLDRWGVDLNALMLKPGARRARAALRGAREVKRGLTALERYARKRRADLRRSAEEDETSASSASSAAQRHAAHGSNGSAPPA